MFEGLKPGNWTVTEELPDGFAGAKVYCAADGGDAKPIAVIRNNTARIRTSDGQSQSCQCFNITRQPSQTAAGAQIATLTLLCGHVQMVTTLTPLRPIQRRTAQN